MSWQAAVFAGLGLIVVAGFWWYERSRPSARLVALVAALAALAIAGRLVLAPIPNVVATTDIVLITGYALGAGPGFAVGALAAPISNIWLGQGPWTAWEMAGWGLVGLGGAWLAVLTRRRLGRLGLATVCALAGFAYGALLDLSVMVTYGGEQSLDRYLALSARGLPFNVAHAAGNFVIALAAGPALVRMISRFRTRLEFTWRPAGALPLVLVALVAVGVAGRPAATDAAKSSAAWLVETQNDDGGFSATPGQPSSPAMTGWAMLGLEAAGTNPLDLRRGGETPVSYLRAEARRLRSAGDLERTILALEAAGVDSRRFAGNDLVERLRRRRDGDGSVDGQVNLTAFYALALRAAGSDPASLARTGRWLRRAQNDDGGWGIQPLAPSEADSTGAALQGLVAVGDGRRATVRGASWLGKAQRRGGGYALGGSGVINSQSTAWAIQGLAATGGSSGAVDAALSYLRHRRAADGHYRYSASSDQTPTWVTAQTLLAVERQPFPLPAVARAARANHADSGGSTATGGAGDPAPDSASSAGSSSTPSSSSGSVEGSPGGAGGAGGAGRDAGTTPNASADPGSVSPATAATTAPGATAAAGSPDQPAGADDRTTPVSVSYAPAGDSTTTYLLVGVGALALLVAGAYAWYRRRAAG